MELLEQGSMELLGAECFGSLEEANLYQEIGSHGRLSATLWLRPGIDCEKNSLRWKDMPVTLIPSGREREPLFSGLIQYVCFQNVRGRPAVKLEAYSHTIRLDQVKKTRSFQQESRTGGELAQLLLSPYQASCIWSGKGREEAVGRFLMQYKESDWEFLRRLTSFQAQPVIVEARYAGAKMFIGLPPGRTEIPLVAESWRIKKTLDKPCKRLDNKTTGGIVQGLELEVEERWEDYQLGDPVGFLGGSFVISGKYSRLKGNQWVHDYKLKKAGDCRMERMDNLELSGGAVKGSVLETTPESTRLALVTDGAGEKEESFHLQPVYYAGSGKGYSGQPEKGDTQYLYFPTMKEEDRYIIGGADAGTERISGIVEQSAAQEAEDAVSGEAGKEQPSGGGQAAVASSYPGGSVSAAALSSGGASSGGASSGGATSSGGAMGGETGGGKSAGAGSKPTPETMPDTKNWSTPGKQSLILNSAGVSLSNGSGNRITLMQNGIKITSKKSLMLEAEEFIATGTELSMEAKDFIWIGTQESGVLLLPDEVQIKAPDLYLMSPENEYHPIPVEEESQILLGIYEEGKKSILPFSASDGSIIQPDGYDDILYGEQMMEYFDKYVYGKGEYKNDLNQPYLTFYTSWLTEEYGQTKLQKFWTHLETLDGLQDMLDGVGIFCEGGDLVNALISLLRGNWKEAALSIVCMVPLIGDIFGKGGKKALSIAESVGTTVKLGKDGGKVLSALELTYKAFDGKAGALLKSLDEVIESLGNLGRYGSDFELSFAGMGRLDNNAMFVFNMVDDAGDSIKFTKYLDDLVVKGGSGAKANILDDPKIAKDIVADPDSVYGYRPKPGSPLDQFDIDWSNADEVAKARAARLEYLEAMNAKKAKLSTEVENYLADGKSMREIAEIKANQRNMDRINSYIEKGDYENLEKLYERNILEYGNKEGPTLQQLYEKYGSYKDVIYSSVKVNEGMNAILGIGY